MRRTFKPCDIAIHDNLNSKEGDNRGAIQSRRARIALQTINLTKFGKGS